MPVASLIVDGALWFVEDLHCGYLATYAIAPRTVVVGETFQELLYAVCDAMGTERVDLASCTWRDTTPVKGLT